MAIQKEKKAATGKVVVTGETVVRKVSTTTVLQLARDEVGGKTNACFVKQGGGAVMIMAAAGYATGCDIFVSEKTGESTGLVGEFSAVPLVGKDRPVYTGKRLFLPEMVTANLLQSVSEKHEVTRKGTGLQSAYDFVTEDGEVLKVRFAVKVGVKESTATMGFEYTYSFDAKDESGKLSPSAALLAEFNLDVLPVS